MKIISIALISIVVGLGVGWIIFSPSSNDASTDTSAERKIMYYRDPMNPQNTSETPKKAPDGMDYVPVYEEASSGGEKKIAYYQDPMHPWFTSDKPGKAPDCGMDLVPVYEGGSDAKGIKIDPRTIQNMGVKTEPVSIRTLTKEIRAVGKIDFDETRVYNVNTKYMGWIEKLYADYTGKFVQKGEALMELYSPDLVNAQQEYLQAYGYKQQMEQSSLDEMKKSSS
ncbi:efflux RND transporter periplasmic adaptor subunit, partial [bacterium]|nr:efflux RND transporter periplasmic adaptor subunit [bacterium]